VFSSVRVVEAETIDADGDLDMTIIAQDGPPRTLGIGATVSTNEGLGIEAFWQHNNLFGRAERLRFEASATSLGLVGAPEIDYNVAVSFLRPGVFNPNADFIASLGARAVDLDTYRETSATGKVGLQRTNARNINGELSLAVTRARFEDFFGTRDFLMVIPNVRGDYDRRDDTLDPSRGYYLQADLRPFYEFEYGNFGARGTLEGRVYHGFGARSDFVLAARARVGSYYGPDEEESPPDQLFFAGGSGSVRGYAYRSIGVEFTKPNGNTGIVGGRSLIDGSIEGRYRATPRFGGVGFLDAGYVSPDSRLGGFDDAELRLGAGVGLRYFTGLGPLRVDVATPINRRPEDSLAAFYVGIGQAF
jgi:translocation and assembly module TamA